MINQRSYPDIALGYGSASTTIAGYGCYMISIYDELKARGIIDLTVQGWNSYLKNKGVYTPSNPTMLSSSSLAALCPDIFTEGRNEAWSDAGVIKYLITNRKEYVLIGEVDARGIGGSGQHFVKIDYVDVVGGKITMTYIDDPWGGLENQKVTTRYNAYGNIKSLRVFRLKQGANMVQVDDKKFTELVTKSTQRDNVWSYLGITTQTDDKGAISVVAGLKSRITDLGNQLGNVLDLEWKGSDGVSRKLSWYVAEAVNRTEQVSTLKVQLLNSEKDKNAVTIELNKLKNSVGVDVAYWTGRVSNLEHTVEQLGVDKGALNTTIVEMQKTEQDAKIKIESLTQQLADKNQPAIDEISLQKLVSAVVKKLISGNWS